MNKKYFFILFSFGLLLTNENRAEILQNNSTVNILKPILSNEDSIIKQAIQIALQSNSRIASPNISVEVNNGVVSIKGNFNSIEEASAAIETANSVPGVLDINASQMVLAEGTPPNFNDVIITARIKGVYIRENVLKDKPLSDISIETRDGVVYLTGVVDTLAQAKQIEVLARSISNEVIARIAVRFP